MMFQARRSSRRGRRTAALALPPLLIALALLAWPDPAAAQRWPDIKVYHSPDDDGVDPRSETCPPGCRCDGSGPGGTVTIDFDGLEPYTVVAGQYPEASFAANGTELWAFPVAGECGSSGPNWIKPMMDCSDCNEDVNVYFKSPVSNLTFTAVPTSNDYGGATVEVYESGALSATLNINVDCYSTGTTVDLSEYSNVTRIHIRNVFNSLAYDNFSFAMGGGSYDCVINGGANEKIDLWINGGSSSGDGDICKLPPDGDTGDYLCGADILLEITRGTGKLTHFRPVIDTLVQNPVCQGSVDDDGFCPLPPDTKRIRMNFRRGEAAIIGATEVADLLVDSTGSTQAAPTTLVVSGVAAASANLQVRPIAAGGPEVIAEGPVGAEEECVLECDFDGNGAVGGSDFNEMGLRWGQTGAACTRPGPNPALPGDCDCNGAVGFSDFIQLGAEWGLVCPAQ